MPGPDLAQIVLSQSPYRSAALRDYSAAKQRSAYARGDAVERFGDRIGNLLQQKIEDDDVKSISEAFSGSYALDGDEESAMKAVRFIRPRTAAGARAKLELVLRHNTRLTEQQALQANREAEALKKKQRETYGALSAGRTQMVPGFDVGAIPSEVAFPEGEMPVTSYPDLQ